MTTVSRNSFHFYSGISSGKNSVRRDVKRRFFPFWSLRKLSGENKATSWRKINANRLKLLTQRTIDVYLLLLGEQKYAHNSRKIAASIMANHLFLMWNVCVFPWDAFKIRFGRIKEIRNLSVLIKAEDPKERTFVYFVRVSNPILTNCARKSLQTLTGLVSAESSPIISVWYYPALY